MENENTNARSGYRVASICSKRVQRTASVVTNDCVGHLLLGLVPRWRRVRRWPESGRASGSVPWITSPQQDVETATSDKRGVKEDSAEYTFRGFWKHVLHKVHIYNSHFSVKAQELVADWVANFGWVYGIHSGFPELRLSRWIPLPISSSIPVVAWEAHVMPISWLWIRVNEKVWWHKMDIFVWIPGPRFYSVNLE